MMRVSKLVEAYRVLDGDLATRPGSLFGYANMPGPFTTLRIVWSGEHPDVPDLLGWEHVSVSTKNRCPNWPEMCFVKDQFWEPEDCVMQLHPPQSQHINNHPYCLHLWRPIRETIPMPPSIMDGIKSVGLLRNKAEADAVRDAYFEGSLHDDRSK